MTATLNPADTVVTFMGRDIQDFSDGTYIEIDYDEDQTSEHVGATGAVTRMINLNEMATVTLTLGQASPSNAVLSAIANADRRSGGGKGPIQIEDLSTGTLYVGREAWIKKHAKGEHAKEHTARVWVLKVAKLKTTITGVDAF